MMPPAALSIFVALANLIVIAMGFTVATGHYFMDVLAIGAFPAVLVGLGTARLEQRLRGASPLVRLGKLAAFGCGVLATAAMLVTLTGRVRIPIQELVLLSCIPTTVAAALVERWTRVDHASRLARATISR